MKAELNFDNVPEPVHIFPAAYARLDEDDSYGAWEKDFIVLATSLNGGFRVYDDGRLEVFECCDYNPPFNCDGSWERLPAGTVITLTQE
jgi:hypothetical protein